MQYKVAMVSLGCAKNLVDSEVMLGLLSENGYELVEDPGKANIIVINTCGFITDAKQESIDTIIEMGQYKEKGSCRLLVITGCLPQRYGDELMKELPEIDVLLGTTSFTEIVEAIKKSLEGRKVLNVKGVNREIEEGLPRMQSTPDYTAYLKIADGCDNCCSYCIIPRLRGRYRSRKEEYILGEARLLARKGVKELILIAQDTTKYGLDLYGERRLPRLLNELVRIDGIKWIRLLYCYPDGITKELIDTIKSEEKICNYLDIPLQHVSTRVLERMNRRYTEEDIVELIERLKEEIPGLVLRTTMIVGFPGETEGDFNNLLEFVKKGYFDRLGVFTYSREEGTPAYNMEGQVPRRVAKKREELIMKAQQRISLEKNTQKIGRVFEVLVEGKEDDMYFGRTYGDSPEIDGLVLFKSKKAVNVGDFVLVRIDHALEYDLIGESIYEPGK